MNGRSLKSYLENFPPIFVQRASNLENSTYDLYTIPKDADSQNPDGKHFLISRYSSECLLLYSCLLLLLLSPTVCVLYIKKLHFCKPPIGFFFSSCFPMSLQHTSFGRLPAYYITRHWLEKFMFIPNFYCYKYIFYNFVISNFPFSLSTQQAAFLACQQRWILTRYVLFEEVLYSEKWL